VIATALPYLVLLGSARGDGVKSDESGLASVYSTLSEETASGQDTSVNDSNCCASIAAHKLDFDDLTKACLKILSIPEDQPIKEK
jgi:hypothetical protein